jgi:hypothetical protein
MPKQVLIWNTELFTIFTDLKSVLNRTGLFVLNFIEFFSLFKPLFFIHQCNISYRFNCLYLLPVQFELQNE